MKDNRSSECALPLKSSRSRREGRIARATSAKKKKQMKLVGDCEKEEQLERQGEKGGRKGVREPSVFPSRREDLAGHPRHLFLSRLLRRS